MADPLDREHRIIEAARANNATPGYREIDSEHFREQLLAGLDNIAILVGAVLEGQNGNHRRKRDKVKAAAVPVGVGTVVALKAIEIVGKLL